MKLTATTPGGQIVVKYAEAHYKFALCVKVSGGKCRKEGWFALLWIIEQDHAIRELNKYHKYIGREDVFNGKWIGVCLIIVDPQ